MVVLSVPKRLGWAASLLLISIPLISLEVFIVARAPFWKPPYRNIGYWALTFALISTPLLVWIRAAKKWALTLAGCLATCWLVASSWMTLHMGYPELGFFTLFLLLYFFALFLSLKYEMGRSFIDPELPWYQGMPKPIPGLKCQLSSPQIKIDLEVCRLDRDGSFLFGVNLDGRSLEQFPSLLLLRELKMIFYFRDRQVECLGRPIIALSHGVGMGVQFLGTTDDVIKDIGDFVEVLRGEGYV